MQTYPIEAAGLEKRRTIVALSDLLKLADEKLADLFHKKQHNPEKARNPILRGIDRTRNQFESAIPIRGKKWFKVSNNVVAFSPPFDIGGKSLHYIPSERFPDYLAHLRQAVEAGELDDSLGQAPATKRKPRPSAGKPWTPERRAKFAASVAARTKAKTKKAG